MQTTALKTNEVGHTGVGITRVGFGAWALDGVSGSERPYVFTKASLLEGPGRRIAHSLERAYGQEHGIGVIAYSPTGSGMLTGAMTRERAATLPESDWRKHDPRFNEPQLSRNLELVERLTTVADRHDTSPGAVAIAWTLRNPAVDAASVGFRRPDQVDPLVNAANLELTADDITTIEGAN